MNAKAHPTALEPSWHRGRTLPAALAILLGAVSVQAARAQSAAPVPVGAASAPVDSGPAKVDTRRAADSTELQTVVVTAQKRSQSAKEIPYGLSVLSGTDIEAKHIMDIEDIARATPGVSFGAGGGPGMDTITMRGVSSQGGGATVGVFLNDTSIVTQNSFNPSYSGATQPLFFDLERVEVLRGPQGTLYGASSMGGALRYVTNSPDLNSRTNSLTTDVSGTKHGGLNTNVIGVTNVPLNPGTSAIRVAIDLEKDSGYIDRYAYIGPTQAAVLDGIDDSKAGDRIAKGTNTHKAVAVNVTGEFKLGDGYVLSPEIFGQKMNNGDTSVFYPKLGLDKQDKLVPEKSSDLMLVPSLALKKDLGWADFTGIASYFYRKNDHTSDGTYFNSDFIQYLADTAPDTGPCQCGVPFWSLPGPSVTQQKTSTTSLEMRLASKLPQESGKPYSWLGGVAASQRRITVTDNEYVTGVRQTFINLYGEPPEDSSFADAFLNDSLANSSTQDNDRQIALFGEGTWYFTPALRLTGGLRLSSDRTHFGVNQGGYFAQGTPLTVSLSNHYSGTTPKLALSYDATKDATLYVNATKGSRIGGYIFPIDTTTGLCPAALAEVGITNPSLSYKQDSLWSYEAGAKTSWLDKRLAVNASVYYIDWKGVQQTFSLSCGSAFTANFGNARSVGTELEMVAKPFQGLTLSASAGTTNAKLTHAEPNVGAVTGQHLLNTPDFTAQTSINYAWNLSNQYAAFTQADYSWTGKSYGSYNKEDIAYERKAYGKLNASVGISNDKVSVSLYAKNLLNNQKTIQEVAIELLESAYTLEPRTIGVRVAVDF